MAGEIRVGTSGWQYDDWRGAFYPDDLPVGRWLEHYAGTFSTVEVNSTFYRLASRQAVRGWADTAPEHFEFACKGSRFITHQKKLKDPHEPVERFFAPLAPLSDHLEVVLWQLPPRWRRDPARLDEFLRAVPGDVRHAVELRDDDWFHDETYEVLDRNGASLVWLSSALTRRHPDQVRTGDHVYLRFHGLDEDEPYRYDYARRELEPWAEQLRAVADEGTPAWVYFNNDHAAKAVANAHTLVELLGDVARPWPPGD